MDATRLLCRTLADLRRPPPVLVSASAIGYYGDRGDEELTEASGPGTGFQAEVCRAWEAATAAAPRAAGIRVVHLRSAVVLSPTWWGARHGSSRCSGPAWAEARVGPQWFSWISLRDEVGVILRAIEDAVLVGPVNASAPAPVTNREFTERLGRVLHRPAVLAVPPFALRLALGRQLADELAPREPPGPARPVWPSRLPASTTPRSDGALPPLSRWSGRDPVVSPPTAPVPRSMLARSSPPGSRARTGTVTPLST